MIEVIPEEIIFSYLQNKREFEKVLPKSYLKYMPQFIEITEDFTDIFQKYITGRVMTKLTQNTGFAKFYFIENDNTVSYDITEKKLWNHVSFNFSRQVIDILWQDIIKQYKLFKEQINDWDAVFLHIENSPYIFQKYRLDEISVDCNFLAMNYLFKNIFESDIKRPFPLIKHFEDYKNTDYSKRFLLIKKASEYYKYAQLLIKNISEQIIMTQGQQSFNYRAINYYEPNNPMKIFKTFSHELFAYDLVKTACNYWLNQVLAYDDYNYITSVIKESNLNENINNLKNEINILNSIRINQNE